MRKKLLICLAVNLALIGLLQACAADPGEPTYRDRPLSEWIKALDEADPNLRQQAIDACYHLGPKAAAAVPALVEAIKALTNRDYALGSQIFRALCEIGPASVKPLTVLLQSEDFQVAAGAAQTLGKIGPAAKDAIPELVGLLRDNNNQGLAAVEALGEIGQPALAALREALRGRNPTVRSGASRALAHMGKSAVPELMAALQEDDDSIRQLAASALSQIGPAAKAAVPRLTEMLQDDNATIREYAAFSLSSIAGADAKAAVPVLIAVLSDREADEHWREGAALALSRIGAAAEPAVPDLVRLQVSGKYLYVREASAKAVRSIDPKGVAVKKAVPLLIEVLKGGSDRAKESAAYFLGRIGPDAKEAVPELTKLLGPQQYQYLQQAAGTALGQIDPEAAKKARMP